MEEPSLLTTVCACGRTGGCGVPEPRMGHVMVPWSWQGRQGFLVWGGKEAARTSSAPLGDAWFFEPAQGAWVEVEQRPADPVAGMPTPALYAGGDIARLQDGTGAEQLRLVVAGESTARVCTA